jgi:hypothetical protein
MGTLVMGSIIGFWILSVRLITGELTNTFEDGQLSSVELVSADVLGFFQIASAQAVLTAQMYNISFARSPDFGPRRFQEDFGTITLVNLQQSVWLNYVLVAQPRNPDLVNPDYPACDMDITFIGLTFTVSPHLRYIYGDPCPGRPKHDDLGPYRGALGASSVRMWEYYGLTGNFEDGSLPMGMSSGLQGPTWQQDVEVINDENDESNRSFSILKGVQFNLPGPSWAPHGAFGRATIRVADYWDGRWGFAPQFADANLQTKLQDVAAESRHNPVVFLITQEGELIASSLAGQRIEQSDSTGRVVGLVRADDAERVAHPIQPIAKILIDAHCTSLDTDVPYCNWDPFLRSSLEYVTVTGGPHQSATKYCVVALQTNDPVAQNLNMLLVDVVESSQITAPLDEIMEKLLYLEVLIASCAMLLFGALSCHMTKPLRSARDNMLLLGDMEIDKAMERYSGTGRCGRASITEASDLRMSFLHAAGALRDWRRREVERSTLLEEERSQNIRLTVEKAMLGAGRLMHPMVVVSAGAFVLLDKLASYEELRDSGQLVFLDTEDDLANFKMDRSIIFLSHQWLAWGFPDDECRTHLNAMKSAVKTVSQQTCSRGGRCAWQNFYVWVDYCSISQDNRCMQALAVSSLPVYAASADVFVIVAPPARHVQSQVSTDLESYNARGWCRAEMLAKICSTGLENFYVLSTEGGDLQRVTEEGMSSLSMYVFEGEFSCCQRGHHGCACDKEALVEPVLGLYSLMLRHASGRRGQRRHMDTVSRHIRQSKMRFFPTRYAHTLQNGQTEERELFGPLVEELEAHVEKEVGVEGVHSTNSPVSEDEVYWVY